MMIDWEVDLESDLDGYVDKIAPSLLAASSKCFFMHAR